MPQRRRHVEVWGAAQRSSCLQGMTVVACRDAGFRVFLYLFSNTNISHVRFVLHLQD